MAPDGQGDDGQGFEPAHGLPDAQATQPMPTGPVPQPGQRQPGQRQPGQRQPGQRQPGQRQPGQRQPGEPEPVPRQPGQREPGQRAPRRRAPKRRRPFRRVLYRFALVAASVAASLLIGFGLLLVFTPSAGQATVIAARLARERHIPYPGPAVPANFSRPLVATEDHRFYSEIGGIDPVALARGARALITNGPDGGGATIELQLAKLLYIGDNSPRRETAGARLTEVALAVKLSGMYGKPQILQLYAEVAYYGHGYYGLQQASCGYFGRPARDLTVTQGAMLAGAVNAPTLDDPIAHPARARARLAHVIFRMAAVGYLTPGQGKAALAAPLNLTPGHSPDC
jgi:membrane peptidoglycan carboxypeptidase